MSGIYFEIVLNDFVSKKSSDAYFPLLSDALRSMINSCYNKFYNTETKKNPTWLLSY